MRAAVSKLWITFVWGATACVLGTVHVDPDSGVSLWQYWMLQVC